MIDSTPTPRRESDHAAVPVPYSYEFMNLAGYPIAMTVVGFIPDASMAIPASFVQTFSSVGANVRIAGARKSFRADSAVTFKTLMFQMPGTTVQLLEVGETCLFDSEARLLIVPRANKPPTVYSFTMRPGPYAHQWSADLTRADPSIADLDSPHLRQASHTLEALSYLALISASRPLSDQTNLTFTSSIPNFHGRVQH